jgi:hypothetical protein
MVLYWCISGNHSRRFHCGKYSAMKGTDHSLSRSESLDWKINGSSCKAHCESCQLRNSATKSVDCDGRSFPKWTG